MKQLHFSHHIFLLITFSAICSCSNNDEPEYHAEILLPKSISTDHVLGYNQSFEYDDKGRVTTFISGNDTTSYTYLNDDTIIIDTHPERFYSYQKFKETLHLTNGKATCSEGVATYIESDRKQVKKYYLYYEYDDNNHLTSYTHSEPLRWYPDVTLIPEEAWNNPWEWDNIIMWEDGNIIEFRDKQGSATSYIAFKYKYNDIVSDHTLVVPVSLTGFSHHSPLMMQGLFGENSKNLISEVMSHHSNGKIIAKTEYEYTISDGHIINYGETPSWIDSERYVPTINYDINWVEYR
ncbi:MAG: hypothetical protein NC095_06095 [Muribaculum sp.]|nr:hypothetical protein [Muribaculum sp.]